MPRNSSDARDIRAEYRHIRRPVRGWVFSVKLAVVGMLTASAAALIHLGTIWSLPLGIIVMGLTFAHAVELQHEALHSIGFRNPRANVVAGVILGLPMLTSFAAYRASHMRHHRDLGTPGNREFFDYGDQYGSENVSRPRRLLSWLYRFSMIAHYGQFFVVLAKLVSGAPLEGEKPATVRAIRRDYAIMALLLVLGTAGSLAFHSLFLVWTWLVPLLLIASPAHAAIELPEHYRCDTDTTDPLRNTRTIRSNRLMAWYTNGNNFHVEHHLMPNLPIAQLGELHQAMEGRPKYYHRTYRDFFRSLRATASQHTGEQG
ncbi:fatty acid desaturase [Streptomyces sp. NPDC051001]|uniref:fatty acid desaturase family protein n=1 Tax=Streptomyces sp. NPDC051001 TaxID=3155795 RepID=UPI00343DA103